MSSGTPSYLSLLRTWTRASSHLFNSMIVTNRAAVAAFSDASDQETPAEEYMTSESTNRAWDLDRSIQREGTLSVGDSIRFSKTLAEADVGRFATASGDTNPLHLDVEAAQETRFDGRIVHGTLVAGLISAALARFPGDVIYLSQDTEFLRPVRIGDRATAVIEVTEDLGDDRYRLTTLVLDPDEETAIDGEATVLIDNPSE